MQKQFIPYEKARLECLKKSIEIVENYERGSKKVNREV